MLSYYPHELQLNWPEVKRIFVGDCGGKSLHYHRSWDISPLGGGHAHMCPSDPAYNSICIDTEKHLYTFDRTGPSDLLWHEYGHVLTPAPKDYFVTCVGRDRHEVSLLFWDDHGEDWRQTMRRLGKPNLQDKYVFMAY